MSETREPKSNEIEIFPAMEGIRFLTPYALFTEVVDYLSSRPYKEVCNFLPDLLKCPQVNVIRGESQTSEPLLDNKPTLERKDL